MAKLRKKRLHHPFVRARSVVHVRLYTRIGSDWLSRDYSYIAFDARADITSPSGGSTLTSASQTFSWSAGSGVDQYWITVGSTPGATDYVSQDAGSATSAALTDLPTDGNTMHVRLYSRMGTDWYQNDYTYVAFDGRAAINSPAQGATLSGASQTFSWIAGTGVDQYWLTIGTTQGADDIYSQDQGAAVSAAVTGLPQNGSTIHARLFSRLGTVWVQRDFTYTAVSGVGKISTPTNGSTLTGTSQAVSWAASPGSLASQYWLTAGSTAGASDYYSGDMGSGTSHTLTGLPTDGSTIHVRLYSLIGSDWFYEEVGYNAFDGRGAISSPSSGATLSGSSQTFSWNAGTGVDQFWLTVGSSSGGSEYLSQDMASGTSHAVTGLPTDGSAIYVRLYSRFGSSWAFNDSAYSALNGKASIASPSGGSTLPASQVNVTWSAGTGAQQYWLTAGSSPGAQDYFSEDMGTAEQGWLTGLPADGSAVYVRLLTRIGSTWLYDDVACTAFSGTSQYWLTVGSTAGASDYFSGDMGLQTSFTVSGLPTDSSTLHFRLFSRIGDEWLYRDYTYTAWGG